MTDKKPKGSGDSPLPSSMLEVYAKRRNLDGGRVFYRAIAEIVRARFDPIDAAIVAPLFERLAAGEKPTAVFGPGGGRKIGAVKTTRVNGKEVSRPDDFTLAWNMRAAIGIYGRDAVFAEVARRYGMEKGSVSNLYRRVVKELGPEF